MSSDKKWDRDGYVERVGGEQEAERRRKALMARQGGYRLAKERKRHGLTQAQLADVMGITPGRVSQIERGEVSTLDAIVRYVEAARWTPRSRRQFRRSHADRDNNHRRAFDEHCGGGRCRTCDLSLARHPTVSAMLTCIFAGHG